MPFEFYFKINFININILRMFIIWTFTTNQKRVLFPQISKIVSFIFHYAAFITFVIIASFLILLLVFSPTKQDELNLSCEQFSLAYWDQSLSPSFHCTYRFLDVDQIILWQGSTTSHNSGGVNTFTVSLS